MDFGAYGDGIHNDAAAIQAAIIACSNSGGGSVVLKENTIFRSGKIVFYDGVNLHIEKGAILIASNDISDFNSTKTSLEIHKVTLPTWENCDYSGRPTQFFIYAEHCNNISITGEGTIDGNEEIFYGAITKWHIDGYYYPRVPLIYFEDCRNVRIEGVTLQRSAFWTTHLVGCKDVLIENVRIINNLRLANCDGIDPDHCKNVTIRNCYIESADDCIVFKTTEGGKTYGACENIEVSDCTLISTSAAIKFGTESVSDFKNIRIKNCSILKSNRGISFQLRDEGNIHDISFENIIIETLRFSPEHWWGKAEPISITAVKRRKESIVGKIERISFKNITMDCENGIFIYGNDNKNIENICFENLNLKITEKTHWDKKCVDVRPCEEIGIIKKEMNALYIKNAKAIHFSDFSYTIDDNIRSSVGEEILYEKSEEVTIL